MTKTPIFCTVLIQFRLIVHNMLSIFRDVEFERNLLFLNVKLDFISSDKVFVL